VAASIRSLDLGQDVERVHRGPRWPRPLFLLALLGLAAAALADVFGQAPETSSAATSAATLVVQAPDRLRGGLYFQGRFTVRAHRPLAHPTLVLDRGWLDQMSVNSIVPQPERQGVTHDGRTALSFGRLVAGGTLVAYVYFQVNPTNVGSKRQDVELRDGARVLARVRRDLVVFP
jgi:hypothetical protein